jgi:hypothetical protein
VAQRAGAAVDVELGAVDAEVALAPQRPTKVTLSRSLEKRRPVFGRARRKAESGRRSGSVPPRFPRLHGTTGKPRLRRRRPLIVASRRAAPGLRPVA